MIQWVTDCTKYREDKSSRLDLLFTKGINLKKDINHECPFGRSDHVGLEIAINRIEDKLEKSYIKKRRNYAKTNHCNEEVFQ